MERKRPLVVPTPLPLVLTRGRIPATRLMGRSFSTDRRWGNLGGVWHHNCTDPLKAFHLGTPRFQPTDQLFGDFPFGNGFTPQ